MSGPHPRYLAALARCEEIEREHPLYDNCPAELIQEHEEQCRIVARYRPSPDGFFRVVDGEIL